MAILNYTTKIDPIKTIGEIQGILAKHGACSVSTEFANSIPIGVNFAIDFNGDFLNFKLPSNAEGVYQALQKDEQVPARYKTQEQARRVAWRITKNWVEAQLAIVEARLATLPEVFLPYAITRNGQTLYQLVEQKKLPLLTGGRTDEQ
ncbi:MAG: hypothetical protein RMY28_009250 [Nostoc sp. ChiSLP01]|nr:hypothetical protein [Nostoc sp. CmiSLP01]MDZ8285257.1 hypothetical protein [Nostoc sp. ChiSLP01]